MIHINVAQYYLDLCGARINLQHYPQLKHCNVTLRPGFTDMV